VTCLAVRDRGRPRLRAADLRAGLVRLRALSSGSGSPSRSKSAGSSRRSSGRQRGSDVALPVTDESRRSRGSD